MASNTNIFDEKVATIGNTGIDLKSIFIAVAVIIASYILARLLNRYLLRTLLGKLKVEKPLKRIILAVNKSIIIIIGIFVAFKVLGVNLSSLAVFAGFFSIGLGFGMQNLISNLFSGFIIYFEKPIKVGDFIELNGLKGYVHSIKARSTTIITRDNISIITPNSSFVTNNIINWSHQDPKVRIHIPVGIEMTPSKLELARSILIDIAKSHDSVLKEPGPDVWFTEFGNSTFNLVLLVWIDSHIHENYLRSDINTMIAKRFAENGIDIVYPIQNLIFKNKLDIETLPRDHS